MLSNEFEHHSSRQRFRDLQDLRTFASLKTQKFKKQTPLRKNVEQQMFGYCQFLSNLRNSSPQLAKLLTNIRARQPVTLHFIHNPMTFLWYDNSAALRAWESFTSRGCIWAIPGNAKIRYQKLLLRIKTFLAATAQNTTAIHVDGNASLTQLTMQSCKSNDVLSL